ncbi:MAG: hypothetical protein NVS3B21_10580 [Acidimicrobiales bacterium]
MVNGELDSVAGAQLQVPSGGPIVERVRRGAVQPQHCRPAVGDDHMVDHLQAGTNEAILRSWATLGEDVNLAFGHLEDPYQRMRHIPADLMATRVTGKSQRVGEQSHAPRSAELCLQDQ